MYLPKIPPLPANTFVDLPTGMERGPLYVLYYDMVNTPLTRQMEAHKQLLDFVDHAQPGTRFALFVNMAGLHLVQDSPMTMRCCMRRSCRKDWPKCPSADGLRGMLRSAATEAGTRVIVTSGRVCMRVPLTFAFLLGLVSGSRSMLAPAAVSRAARAGGLRVKGTPLAFMEGRNLNRLLLGLALAELVADKLPMTPSRKAAAAFAARLATGALAGAAVGAETRRARLGALLGIAGAVVGTQGGAAFRSWLASLFDRDLPAAVIEDLVTFALIGFVSSKIKDCALPAKAA